MERRDVPNFSGHGHTSVFSPTAIPTSHYSLEQWEEADQIASTVTNAHIKQERYSRGAPIGRGGTSDVLKVRRNKDGVLFAGKWSRNHVKLMKEAGILQHLDHRHILEYVDWETAASPGRFDPESELLVTELCTRGTLQAQIDAITTSLPREQVLHVLLQVSSGLDYLHSRGLIHTDIKPRNIFLRALDPLDVVIGDLTDLQSVHDLPPGPPRSTRLFFSPEVLRSQRICGSGDDMWALGITLLGMVGQWPRRNQGADWEREYPRACWTHADDIVKLNPEERIVVDLLKGLLAWRPSERMSAAHCFRVTKALLEKNVGPSNPVFLTIPEGFTPRSFW